MTRVLCTRSNPYLFTCCEDRVGMRSGGRLGGKTTRHAGNARGNGLPGTSGWRWELCTLDILVTHSILFPPLFYITLCTPRICPECDRRTFLRVVPFVVQWYLQCRTRLCRICFDFYFLVCVDSLRIHWKEGC